MPPGVINVSGLGGFNFKPTGAKGRRIGLRERERLRFEVPKAKDMARRGYRGGDDDDDDLDSFDDPIDIGVDYDPNPDEHEHEHEHENGDGDGNEGVEESGLGENDSISNMSLLQPPRRLRKSKAEAGEASVGLAAPQDDVPTVTGHISIQPRPLNFLVPDEINPVARRIDTNNTSDEGGFALDQKEMEKERKRKRARPTDVDVDVARGQVGSSADDRTNESAGRNQPLVGPSMDGKRARLLALAQNLQQTFPEQREELDRVIEKIERGHAGSGPQQQQVVVVGADAATGSNLSTGKSAPIPVPLAKGRRARNGHARAASDGAIAIASGSLEAAHGQASHAMSDIEEEDTDPRGWPPTKKDPLIHVFIDQYVVLLFFQFARSLIFFLKKKLARTSLLDCSRISDA